MAVRSVDIMDFQKLHEFSAEYDAIGSDDCRLTAQHLRVADQGVVHGRFVRWSSDQGGLHFGQIMGSTTITLHNTFKVVVQRLIVTDDDSIEGVTPLLFVAQKPCRESIVPNEIAVQARLICADWAVTPAVLTFHDEFDATCAVCHTLQDHKSAPSDAFLVPHSRHQVAAVSPNSKTKVPKVKKAPLDSVSSVAALGALVDEVLLGKTEKPARAAVSTASIEETVALAVEKAMAILIPQIAAAVSENKNGGKPLKFFSHAPTTTSVPAKMRRVKLKPGKVEDSDEASDDFDDVSGPPPAGCDDVGLLFQAAQHALDPLMGASSATDPVEVARMLRQMSRNPNNMTQNGKLYDLLRTNGARSLSGLQLFGETGAMVTELTLTDVLLGYLTADVRRPEWFRVLLCRFVWGTGLPLGAIRRGNRPTLTTDQDAKWDMHATTAPQQFPVFSSGAELVAAYSTYVGLIRRMFGEAISIPLEEGGRYLQLIVLGQVVQFSQRNTLELWTHHLNMLLHHVAQHVLAALCTLPVVLSLRPLVASYLSPAGHDYVALNQSVMLQMFSQPHVPVAAGAGVGTPAGGVARVTLVAVLATLGHPNLCVSFLTRKGCNPVAGSTCSYTHGEVLPAAVRSHPFVIRFATRKNGFRDGLRLS